jgi:hypothetical protein
LKPALIEQYKKHASTLSVLIITDSGHDEHIKKLNNILKNFCLYQVNIAFHSDSNLLDKVINADFMLFSINKNRSLNTDLELINVLKRPAIGLVASGNSQPQVIRQGNQMIKSGLPVIFQLFTPIRLFTSIDKEYIRYHLCK